MTDADSVLEALAQVMDPELGMSIVDLGLVYHVEAANGQVRVVMTMTTPACPLGQSLAEEAEVAIRRHVPGAKSVDIELVWEPAWQPSMMSEAARQRLGWS